ncbi:MAG: DUF4428 domain-containing protein, partial [Oscillospiraceae bacterium]
KKEPCPICGGKVPMLLSTKIEGQPICNDCAGKIDLPRELENALTLQGFHEYLAFYEENCKLRANFVTSERIDFGVLDTKIVFDYDHKLFCMSTNLDKTIFKGSQLLSVTVWEDTQLLFEGSPETLRWHESRVPAWAEAVAPQIAQLRLNQELVEAIDRLDDDDDDHHHHHNRYVDIPEPFQQFNVELRLDHPYWKVIQCDMSGPVISSSYPDVNDFMNDYARDRQTVGELVYALATVAFPDATECSDGQPAPSAQPAAAPQSPPAAGQDPVEQLRKYKQLMEDGVIDADEFAAKKKQLLGL